MDVESLKKSDRRRLDVFLVTSIILLFMLVAAGVAGGVMVVMGLRAKVEHMRPALEIGTPAKMTGDIPAPGYKMQNFAYLRAKSRHLENGTMLWDPVNYLEGHSIGSHFFFDSNQHSLQPKKKGHYFMYIDINVSCNFNCSAGLLTVRLGDQLTCKVELPKEAESPVSKKCWTVAHMDGETRLLAQMNIIMNKQDHWILDLDNSKLGMFLVD